MGLEELGTAQVFEMPLSVEHALVYDCAGPWKTKADAQLRVAIAMPFHRNGNHPRDFFPPANIYADEFFEVDRREERLLMGKVRETHPGAGHSIKGNRFYYQTGLQKGKKLGGEFHRLRKEIIFPMQGSLNAEIEDIYGGKKEFELNTGSALYLPPFLLHSFEVQEDCILGISSNTMFILHDGEEEIFVPDTYSRESFKELQKRYS